LPCIQFIISGCVCCGVLRVEGGDGPFWVVGFFPVVGGRALEPQTPVPRPSRFLLQIRGVLGGNFSVCVRGVVGLS